MGNAARQLGITIKMKMGWVLFLISVLLLFSPPASAVDGTFRGKVIDPPASQPVAPGWIYVQGRNRMLRRVEVSHAVIVFGEEVPASQRHKCNAECLSAGQEVRVTARQDSAGEWWAKRVEILHVPTQVATRARKSSALPIFTAELSLNWITKSSDSASHRIRLKSNTDTWVCGSIMSLFKRASLLAGVCYEI
ncbi:MAG TPA: hypothetical protein VKL99_10315 [Candidatus Angelobacter sp.]|nr:hypothetical protein [Candidatus Angelobacter sp.]